ncbi:YopX family protein, partial [Peribacillus sp. NPDC056705]|uniref:YopX family protein n=1 Tax=Peribacillus sp. NPDC056705 TaxID=3345918 RepID=UPI00374A47CF
MDYEVTIDPNGKVAAYSPLDGQYVRGFSDSEMIIMQYTGLQDRNGKEIYEGDIVRIIEHGFTEKKDIPDFQGWLEDENVISYEEHDEGWINYKYSKIKDVVVLDRFPVYWLRRESFGYEGEDLVSPSDCEVIGNIHEHGGLIYDSKNSKEDRI